MFKELTSEQELLIQKRNALLDEQESLRVHNFVPSESELSDSDKKHDELQAQIDEINAAIAS